MHTQQSTQPQGFLSLYEMQRNENLLSWLNATLDGRVATLIPLAQSASLRRYYRIFHGANSYVVMDSADLNSCRSFVTVAGIFQSLNLHVPTIYAMDLERGFLLLSDLGDQLYERALNPKTVNTLYQNAFTNLLSIQSCPAFFQQQLPVLDTAIYKERMFEFCEWYLNGLLKINLTSTQQQVFEAAFQLLMETAQSQPQVCIHYDYHCRNLLLVEKNAIGILDFQDAKWGPITYDLMSLLRDCYIDWPVAQVETWIANFQQQALRAGILPETDPALFLRWCDLAGLQMHFKNAGIFAKLSLTQQMDGYLAYLPRVLGYIRHVCSRYSELTEMKNLIAKLPV